MDGKRILIIVVLLFVALLVYASFQEPAGERETKVVTRVIDGDTLVVEGGQRIRLLGIDSQEKGKPCYGEAKKRLEELVLKKPVTLEGEEIDQYGRRLAYILLNRTLINSKLVREGLAVAQFYEEGSRYRDRIQGAEQEAIKNEKGCEWG